MSQYHNVRRAVEAFFCHRAELCSIDRSWPSSEVLAADLQPVSNATKDLLDFSVLHNSEVRFRIDTSPLRYIDLCRLLESQSRGRPSIPAAMQTVQRPLLRIAVVGDDAQSIFSLHAATCATSTVTFRTGLFPTSVALFENGGGLA